MRQIAFKHVETGGALSRSNDSRRGPEPGGEPNPLFLIIGIAARGTAQHMIAAVGFNHGDVNSIHRRATHQPQRGQSFCHHKFSC